MQQDEAARIQKIESEVTVGGNIHAVARDGWEAEIIGDGSAIKRKSASSESTGTERHYVDAGARLLQPVGIAGEHLEISQQIMRPQHRLRAAQMRVAGNDRIRIAAGQIQKRRLQTREFSQQRVYGRAQIQAQIERDLLIAAAAGMNFSGERTGFFAQLANDKGVDVLVARAVEVMRILGFAGDFIEGGKQPIAFFAGQDALARQSSCKSLRAFGIGKDEITIEMERSGKLFKDLRRPGFESSAPELHGDQRFASCTTLREPSGRSCSRARTLMGRPTRLMKPRASFWS